MNYKGYTFNLSEVYDDKVYKSKVINSVSNSIIIFSIIFMIIAYVATAFGIKELNEEIEFNDIIKLLLDKDIILVEGYKNSNLRKIEVYRSGVSDKIITPKEKIIAVASDINLNLENIKVIDKNSIKELADLIEKENEFKFEIYQ